MKFGERGCSSVFYTYCGFKKHLLRVHGDAVASDTVTSGSADNLDTVDNLPVDNVSVSDSLPSAAPVKKKAVTRHV